MIAAIDNFGEAYLSVLQTNNNQYTYSEFVSELVMILDSDRSDWRDDTIWLVDGAKMHTAETVKKIY